MSDTVCWSNGVRLVARGFASGIIVYANDEPVAILDVSGGREEPGSSRSSFSLTLLPLEGAVFDRLSMTYHDLEARPVDVRQLRSVSLTVLK